MRRGLAAALDRFLPCVHHPFWSLNSFWIVLNSFEWLKLWTMPCQVDARGSRDSTKLGGMQGHESRMSLATESNYLWVMLDLKSKTKSFFSCLRRQPVILLAFSDCNHQPGGNQRATRCLRWQVQDSAESSVDLSFSSTVLAGGGEWWRTKTQRSPRRDLQADFQKAVPKSWFLISKRASCRTWSWNQCGNVVPVLNVVRTNAMRQLRSWKKLMICMGCFEMVWAQAAQAAARNLPRRIWSHLFDGVRPGRLGPGGSQHQVLWCHDMPGLGSPDLPGSQGQVTSSLSGPRGLVVFGEHLPCQQRYNDNGHLGTWWSLESQWYWLGLTSWAYVRALVMRPCVMPGWPACFYNLYIYIYILIFHIFSDFMFQKAMADSDCFTLDCAPVAWATFALVQWGTDRFRKRLFLPLHLHSIISI